jgi:hypothetical protein
VCHQAAGQHERAQNYVARLQEMRPGYSRADFFRAFPFPPPEKRALIDTALAELGI